MDKQALLGRVKALWPDAITLRPDGGQDALNNVYWPIEKKLEGKGNEWIALSAWAFHQALWDLAKAKVGLGRAALRPAEVTLESFDQWMRKNLSDETWAQLRHEYDETLD
ncbi:hypothetical protein [Sphingomonas sp. URHD0057]|uniref:hypothetical protein n=1 Tax=Sphingomonas sp. URHD0057 TaxID=1380389 RepID=UPI0004900BFC|nr:hypothetical protein [Sphingomonas sp. URHD0057]